MSRFPGRYPTVSGGGSDGGTTDDPPVTVTSDYTASDGDTVLVDASGGAVDVTLPPAEETATLTVKKIDSTDNPVGLVTPGDATVDGDASVSITSQWIAREVTSDGSDYYVI